MPIPTGRNTQAVRPGQPAAQRAFTTQQPQQRDPWDFAGNFGRDASNFGNNIWQGLQNSPLGQIGAGIGGMFSGAVRDATGQGVSTSIDPRFQNEIRDAIANANLTPAQRQQIQAGVQSGRYASPEDALTEISTYDSQNRQIAQTTAGVSRLGDYQEEALHRNEMDQSNAERDIGNFEQTYLNDPNNWLNTTQNRLNTISHDPNALKSDAEYGSILTNIQNQTLAQQNQQTREAGQRAAGRGVSGAGGAALTTMQGAQQTGQLARADAFRTSLADVQRRLGELNNTRTNLSSSINETRAGNRKYYSGASDDINRWKTQYQDALSQGYNISPYDFSSQAENRIGANVYNQGLQRETLDRVLGVGQNAAALGVQALGVGANAIPQIPGLGRR